MGIHGFFPNCRAYFPRSVEAAELSPAEASTLFDEEVLAWVVDGMTVLTRLVHRVS